MAWFSKAARKARIRDGALMQAVREAMRGQADDLGGGVFKKRLNDNQHRSILLAKGGKLWVFAFLMPRRTAPTSTPTNWWRSASLPRRTGGSAPRNLNRP